MQYISARYFVFFLRCYNDKKGAFMRKKRKLKMNTLLKMNNKQSKPLDEKIIFVKELLLDEMLNDDKQTITITDIRGLDIDFWYEVLSEIIHLGISRSYLRDKINFDGYRLFHFKGYTPYHRNVTLLRYSLLSEYLKEVTSDFSLLKIEIKKRKYKIVTE